MKAIETTYKGYRFRSRLEARWAVFFDAIGVAWEYEPEGFDLGGGVRYLPDFRVIGAGGAPYWYEVKPLGVTSDSKFDLFKKHVDSLRDPDGIPTASAVMLSGDPHQFLSASNKRGCLDIVCPRCGRVGAPTTDPYDTGDHIAVACWFCDIDTPSGGGNPAEKGLLAQVIPHKGDLLLDAIQWSIYQVKVKRAIEASRSARFEFGESGVRK